MLQLVFPRLLVVALVSFATSAYAIAPENWKKTARELVGAYEGKGFGQVTPDTDCQGLSLGIEQNTIQSGSLLLLIKNLPTKKYQDSVRKYMPSIRLIFIEIVRLMQEEEGKPQRDYSLAREKSLELQAVETSKKCAGNRRGTSLKPTAQAELEAWLTSDIVKEAQIKFSDQKLEDAFKIAECFVRSSDDGSITHFRHFLFFYGFVVQAGKAGLADKSLQNATAHVKDYVDYKITKAENIRRKINYLADWLSTKWSDTSDPRYFQDAARNAELLRKLNDRSSSLDVQLMFMRHVRAITGNTPYQLIFMGRGLIDLTGKGWINGTQYDHQKVFEAMGAAEKETRERVSCD
jgi:hypothetical protein